MKILWDFRLFSYGYAQRGIGQYCRAVATAVLAAHPAVTFVIWGERQKVPESITGSTIEWIPYHPGTWKSSIFMLPYLVLRYHIDLIHYWVALGPLHQIGLTPFASCRSCATVYDMGVEIWDIPYLRHIRTTPYWTMQKLFFRRIDAVMAISQTTLDGLGSLLLLCNKYTGVVYPPITFDAAVPPHDGDREKYFITLGGDRHKNCKAVVDAFAQVQRRRPDYSLHILGEIDCQGEVLETLPAGVIREPSMVHYQEHLVRCSGLLFCSLYEGLGLPPLEALQFGCPLLLSSIPPLRETCEGAALFVDPQSVQSIVEGIERLIAENRFWSACALRGAESYKEKSGNADKECLRLYGLYHDGKE